MKKLNLFTGLHKYTVADIEHAQEALHEVMEAMCIGHSDDPVNNKRFILSGCEEYWPNIFTRIVDPGWVYLDGELYYCPGQPNGAAGVACLAINSSYRADNPIPYAQSGAKNVHEIRIVEVQFHPANNIPAGVFILADLVDASTLYLNKIKRKNSDIAWRYIGGLGNPPVQANYPNHAGNTNTDQNMRFRKDVSGQVWMTGIVNLNHWTTVAAPFGNTTELLFRVQPDYYPDNQLVRSFQWVQANGHWVMVSVRVDPDGKVYLEQPPQIYPTGFNSGSWANVACSIDTTYMVKD